MPISITKLRANLYKLVDQVIKTGLPIEIERNGKKIYLMTLEKKSKFANLKPHPGTIIGDPEDLVHLDWSSDWEKNQS